MSKRYQNLFVQVRGVAISIVNDTLMPSNNYQLYTASATALFSGLVEVCMPPGSKGIMIKRQIDFSTVICEGVSVSPVSYS